MFITILAIPFYAAIFMVVCVILFYTLSASIKYFKKLKEDKETIKKSTKIQTEYDKIEVDLTNAKLNQWNLQTSNEPQSAGMITGIGMALGDKNNSETSITKSVSKFSIKIKYKGQSLPYESPYLKTDEITLLFLLNEQKSTTAYISPDFSATIHLDLSFIPNHILTD